MFEDTKRGNQNPYIEEGQTTQWPKKLQKDKQRSTKHTYKTKDRVTRTPLKTGSVLSGIFKLFLTCNYRISWCDERKMQPRWHR